ncbi:hypothetical protein KIN20_003955 [Parelaphostrongylus tenuis]|uniref:Vacuolar ATPase assembly integral membrane protein VMA21 homolog n=1 Tax=Parelaphostrongylus tenuis TaxID=148309 RepID=A0AAD5QIY5_PARTN|nr:hypothetical protein KIN20_003955 [Parelaphostrongylus tenuis]
MRCFAFRGFSIQLLRYRCTFSCHWAFSFDFIVVIRWIQMSGDQDVALREDTSSSTSSLGSFENVSTADMCKSSSEPAITDRPDVPDTKAVDDADPIGSDTNGRKEADQEQFYTSAHAGRAISMLIKFTAAMFVLPLLVMFTTYHYIFRDHYHFPPDEAMLYAGFCGIATVIIIVIIFVYVAYREEQEDEKIRLRLKKSE